jgi:hypothetical protein
MLAIKIYHRFRPQPSQDARGNTTFHSLGSLCSEIASLTYAAIHSILAALRVIFGVALAYRKHLTKFIKHFQHAVLAQRDIETVIDNVVGNKLILASIRRDIIERTDGIPLFVEEMTKAVLEADTEGDARKTAAAIPSPAVAVPASLHASLMARLDQLGSAKEVAQIGAAIGREFSHALLSAVASKSESELASALDRLFATGLLFRQGLPPHASYLFKHALVQDVAYGSLLRERRRALHVSRDKPAHCAHARPPGATNCQSGTYLQKCKHCREYTMMWTVWTAIWTLFVSVPLLLFSVSFSLCANSHVRAEAQKHPNSWMYLYITLFDQVLRATIFRPLQPPSSATLPKSGRATDNTYEERGEKTSAPEEVLFAEYAVQALINPKLKVPKHVWMLVSLTTMLIVTAILAFVVSVSVAIIVAGGVHGQKSRAANHPQDGSAERHP